MEAMSKLDYLKKYMDRGTTDDKRKKKKKKIKFVKNNIKIVDAQISFSDMKSLEEEEHAEYDLMEEKPLMYAADGATIFTKEYEEKEKKKASSWAPLTVNNENRKRHDSSDSDLSPARTNPTSRKTNLGDLDIDVSPPRRRRMHHDSDKSDMSPPKQRKARHDSSASSDMSPQSKNANSDSDLSPEREKAKDSDSDVSPQRNISSRPKNRREEKPKVMSTGRKAGLQTGAELQKENELKRKEEKLLFDQMKPSVSGKGAETVYRKSGKKINLKFEELKKRKEEEEKLQDTEKYAVWGRGVAQEKEHQQKLQDAIQEMQKPLARYKDDKDLENLLKDQDREGDPMLAYLSKKKNKQIDKTPSKPKYNGPAPPPNRFNICPGYRFDGVDRSNGFEKQRFLEINKKKSFNEAKYKWSVEEM